MVGELTPGSQTSGKAFGSASRDETARFLAALAQTVLLSCAATMLCGQTRIWAAGFSGVLDLGRARSPSQM